MFLNVQVTRETSPASDEFLLIIRRLLTQELPLSSVEASVTGIHTGRSCRCGDPGLVCHRVGWRIGGKRLPVNVSVAARTGGRVATFLEIVLGTGGMTRLTTAAQLGIIGDRLQTDHTWFGLSGDRLQTDHTWFGLSHHLLGFWIIHELKCEMRRGIFYRETKGSRGREGTNEKEVPSCFGRGRGGGTPLPPP